MSPLRISGYKYYNNVKLKQSRKRLVETNIEAMMEVRVADWCGHSWRGTVTTPVKSSSVAERPCVSRRMDASYMRHHMNTYPEYLTLIVSPLIIVKSRSTYKLVE